MFSSFWEEKSTIRPSRSFMTNGNDNEKFRLQQLEHAQSVAASGDYKLATTLLEDFIEKNPFDIPARRALANLYELKALDEGERTPHRLALADDFLKAQTHLLQIL